MCFLHAQDMSIDEKKDRFNAFFFFYLKHRTNEDKNQLPICNALYKIRFIEN